MDEACNEGGTQLDSSEEECGYDELVFDRTVMAHTLIEEYQLLCGR